MRFPGRCRYLGPIATCAEYTIGAIFEGVKKAAMLQVVLTIIIAVLLLLIFWGLATGGA